MKLKLTTRLWPLPRFPPSPDRGAMVVFHGRRHGEWVTTPKDSSTPQKDYKIVPNLQGQLRRVHDRRHRGIPRRQCTAHPAGV